MSELLSPLRSQDNAALFEGLQVRLREIAAHKPEVAPSSDVVQVRPSPKMPDDAEAAASVSLVQAEAQRGVNVATVHKGLDPQRVAKLLGLLD